MVICGNRNGTLASAIHSSHSTRLELGLIRLRPSVRLSIHFHASDVIPPGAVAVYVVEAIKSRSVGYYVWRGTETLQLHALNHSAEVVAVVVDVEAEVEGISHQGPTLHMVTNNRPTDMSRLTLTLNEGK